MQAFKSVYFSDCPQAASGRSSLALAFGKRDSLIYEAVRHLSSDTLRRALGYDSYLTLQSAAQQRRQTINSFCLTILREKLDATAAPESPHLPGFEPDNPISIDPIQATFNGGRHEPLHNWYPYLEGYSPAFVETVIGNLVPDSRSILDPFGGMGTTPLTASRLGKSAYYAEVNPVLQFLTASKIVALRLSDKDRGALVSALRTLAKTFAARLRGCRKDLHLQHTYSTSFGNSVFFDGNVLADVLRVRTLIDEIGCSDRHTARFLTVATLRSLIRASRLIRRGDVRYKTEQESARERIDLREPIREALLMIADDIGSLSPIAQAPLLLLENAKNLDRLPPLGVEAVITSPPYLNGTNYFRNTKVELWFLRCLNRNADLAQFRFQAMTVGINDVTVAKPVGDMPSCAKSVVRDLEETSYDPRIPRMVACFASEIHAILLALAWHMAAGGKIVIDIGDSAYAGVHVPTDAFIRESLGAAGFDLTNELILRQRYSRSQMKLTQKLMVFEESKVVPRPHARQRSENAQRWSDSWATFKRTLPHQQSGYAKRNWGHPLHSLCSYQGKMKPSLAAHLVRTFTSPGDKMLDPFSGVGTIPFEAALHGVESWGFDISPPAVHITAGKVGSASTQECEAVLERLEAFLHKGVAPDADRKAAAEIRFNGALASYYNSDTFEEVLLARRYFLDHPPASAPEALVLACMLHILHGNRPYALSRRSHPITPFAPTGPTEYRPLVPRLREKLGRSLATPPSGHFRNGHSVFQDATEWWPADVADLDAIITSPPFFGSTRFYL
ncbi:MAG: DNA methyltransferase, partial [Steroidobacteraceae bacterium]